MLHPNRPLRLAALCASLALAAAISGCGGSHSSSSGPTVPSSTPTSSDATPVSDLKPDLALSNFGSGIGKTAGHELDCVQTDPYHHGIWITAYRVHANKAVTVLDVQSNSQDAPQPVQAVLVPFSPDGVKKVDGALNPTRAEAAKMLPAGAWARRKTVGQGHHVALAQGQDAVLVFLERLHVGQTLDLGQVGLRYTGGAGQVSRVQAPFQKVPVQVHLVTRC